MTRDRQPAVYIVSSQRNGTLYSGATSALAQRSWEHRTGAKEGFSKRYGYKYLVWYELHGTMERAFQREKQLKGGSRADKLRLIEAMNPAWRDLYPDICG